MATIQQAHEQLRQQLNPIYDQREAAAIAAAVTAHITGLDNTGRLVHKHQQLSLEQEHRYQAITTELLQQKPLQYVLHEAHFYGMSLYVDESVLTPRPETEELVDWIIKEVEGDIKYNKQEKRTAQDHAIFNQQYSILDIGTGSGCIPITLKKHLPVATVHALDISEEALAVAKRNAALQETYIEFYWVDILNINFWQQLSHFDIIVSNPPYITQQEAADMHNNVLQFEPHTALFVPNDQPLLFYEAIAHFGLRHLNNNGLLFFEINEVYGEAIMEMLRAKGYQNIELRKDTAGKDRMIKAVLLG